VAVAGHLQRLEGDAVDPAWIERAWLVVAATDDHVLNREVAGMAEAAKRWINVVDDAELSSYQVPAVVDREPITIAISSAGAAPMLARQLREQLEAEIDPSIGELARLFARHRGRIRERLPLMRERRDWFERILAGDIPVLLRAGNADAAEQAFKDALDEGGTSRVRGSVALVGCGDGDPGLLALRALRLLNQADLVLVGDSASNGQSSSRPSVASRSTGTARRSGFQRGVAVDEHAVEIRRRAPASTSSARSHRWQSSRW
jgi:precorrin-2 dehydrogenase/sirohydrochlorin ferrochelatase